MQQTYTDPASGRLYVIDSETGQSRWVDQPPPPALSDLTVMSGPPAAAPARKPKTVSGIVGLIVAVVALTISWVPLVNNVAFVFAIISGVLGVVSLVATRAAGKRSARWAAAACLAVTALVVAVVLGTQALYGHVVDNVGKALKSAGPVAPGVGASSASGSTSDVVNFGAVATFKDGSTLTCSKPVPFKRAEFAAGGDSAKAFLKSRCVFANHSGKTFDPVGTSANMSAAGSEADPVFQDGLGSPTNPVLSGRSVAWWVGYGVQSATGVQLTVSLGFLGYSDVTFT